MPLADYNYVEELNERDHKRDLKNKACKHCGHCAMLGIRTPICGSPECAAKQVLQALATQGDDCYIAYSQSDEVFVIQVSTEIYHQTAWYVLYRRDDSKHPLLLLPASYFYNDPELTVSEEVSIYDFFVGEGILLP